MSTLERLTESYCPRDESEEIWDATIGDALRRSAQEVPTGSSSSTPCPTPPAPGLDVRRVPA